MNEKERYNELLKLSIKIDALSQSLSYEIFCLKRVVESQDPYSSKAKKSEPDNRNRNFNHFTQNHKIRTKFSR